MPRTDLCAYCGTEVQDLDPISFSGMVYHVPCVEKELTTFSEYQGDFGPDGPHGDFATDRGD
jgi:hypothetical protein